jgi:hypothetical protein
MRISPEGAAHIAAKVAEALPGARWILLFEEPNTRKIQILVNKLSEAQLKDICAQIVVKPEIGRDFELPGV